MQTVPIYTDLNALNQISGDVNTSQQEKLENVARQFSSVFTNMVLKSMRQASLGEGIFESDQSRLYQDMFDKQISLQLSQGQGDGLGIADLLVNQFSKSNTSGAQAALNAYNKVNAWGVALQENQSPAVTTVPTGRSDSAHE